MEYGGFWKLLKEKLKWLDPFSYSDLLLKKLGWEENGVARFFVELGTAFLSAFLLYAVIGLLLGTSMPLVIVVSGSMEPVLSRGDVVLLQGVHSGDDVHVQEAWVNQNIAGLSFWDFGTVNYFPDSSAPPLENQLCESRLGRGVYSVVLDGKEYRLRTDGDIVVYFSKFPGRTPEPIIHRAVLKIHAKDGDFFLTKGDSVRNPIFDEDCGKTVLGVPQCSCISLYPLRVQELQGKAVGWIPAIGYVKLALVDDLTQFLQGCPPSNACPSGCCFP